MMSGFIDPVARDLANKDSDSARETRAKFSSYEYLIYQASDLAALNAKNALIASIETQYANARALVAQVMPGRNQKRAARPLSKDEGNPYGR